MKIKEIQKEHAFKPFKIEIEIESADDLLWLYGISNNSQQMTRQHLEEMDVTHKLSIYSGELQMKFYTAMKDLYERVMVQSAGRLLQSSCRTE